MVPRLGYDRPGRVVKLFPRKKTAKIAIGHVTWDVSIDELIPQTLRHTGECWGGKGQPAARLAGLSPRPVRHGVSGSARAYDRGVFK